MVLLRAGKLGIAVAWALPDIEFGNDWEFAKLALRDGATPSELGSIRRFGALGVGVDLGEFEVSDRTLLMWISLVPTRPRRAGSSAGGPVNRYQKLYNGNHSRDQSRIVPMGSRKRVVSGKGAL